MLIMLVLVGLYVSVVALAFAAQESSEREDLRIFARLCGSTIKTVDSEEFVDVKFAPVRRLGENEPPQSGTWGSTYETSEQRYPSDTYIVGSYDGEIDLVSTLHAPLDEGDMPPYLWHLISVPSPNDDRVGFIARHEDLRDREPGVWTRDQYRTLLRSMDDTYLIYLHRGLSERHRSDITDLWDETFDSAMEDLVREHYQLDRPVYTHTFYYHDVLHAASEIGKDGDRRNSSRRVAAAGTAFGFVLDHTGRCLAATTLSLVDNE